MLGPIRLNLERPSFPGSVGPTESSLSLPESEPLLPDLSLTLVSLFAGLPRLHAVTSRDVSCGSEDEAMAFCKVEGSYQPSASSPRFLISIRKLSWLSCLRCLSFLPFTHKALPSPLHLDFIQIIQDFLLLDVQIQCKHRPEYRKVSLGQMSSPIWQLFGRLRSCRRPFVPVVMVMR